MAAAVEQQQLMNCSQNGRATQVYAAVGMDMTKSGATEENGTRKQKALM